MKHRISLSLLFAFGTLPVPYAAEATSSPKAKKTQETDAKSFVFEQPVRLKAGEEFISVESPGYACPTMADIDGDEKLDLVVGQFRNGNMQFCKNVAASGESPRFAAAEWLKSGEDRTTVPGVW